MFRSSFLRRIGVEGDIVFRSVSKDRSFMTTQLGQLGNIKNALPAAGAAATQAAKQLQEERDEEMKRQSALLSVHNTINPDDTSSSSSSSLSSIETFNRRLTTEELNRFTSSVGSKENLFNHRSGAVPTQVVDEATGREIGVDHPDPTNYAKGADGGKEWVWSGRCHDF